MKKACKGGIYPKSSNVSSRLGSYGKKKAQNGYRSRDIDIDSAKAIRARLPQNVLKAMRTPEGKASYYRDVNKADSLMREAERKRRIPKKAQYGTKMPEIKNARKKETGLKSAFENVAQRRKSLKTIGSKIAKPMGKAQVGKALKKYQDWNKKIQSDKEYTKSSFRTADSLRFAKPKATSLEGRLKERKANVAKADSIERAVEKRIGVPRKSNMYEKRTGGKMTKKCKYGCK